MSKNIVVYSDGTGQDGGARPEQRISNIYKMYRISRDHADTAIDPSQQVVFYDAGLGTDVGTTALTAPVRFVQKLLGSVTGAGIKRNIADCYEFIVNHYEEGDRIFLFGFSRGAYTVRSLANLLMLCGVPTKAPAGALLRYRKAVKDIAWEAVDTSNTAPDIRGPSWRTSVSNWPDASSSSTAPAMGPMRTSPRTS